VFDYQRVFRQFEADFDSLQFEVRKLSDLFRSNNFFGDPRNFSHAHFGYLMACMGRIDQYSAL
jgi:hypothetical protein